MKLMNPRVFTKSGIVESDKVPLQSSERFCNLLPVGATKILNATLLCFKRVLKIMGRTPSFRILGL